VLPLDSDVDRHCADIRAALERAGTPIGSHDLFIAAHARCLDLTLVTRNEREFMRVGGLRMATW
jgi:tRNA(fMet)-specific endonuclease VapC